MKEVVIPDQLELKDGIWYSAAADEISYHQEGHENCYQVEDESFWFDHRNKCLLHAVHNFPPPGTILDVGGGNGFVTRMFQDNDYPAILVEPGNNGVSNARQRGVKNIICSTLEHAGFAPGSVQAVGLFDVIEHIEDDGALIRNVAGLMAKEGRIYVTVPAYPLLWSYHDANAGHYRRYTANVICDLLNNNEFEIEYCSYFFSLLTIPNLLLRSVPTRLGWIKKIDDLKTKKKHHIARNSLTNKILGAFWNWELRRIRKKRRIMTGNSCLVVAKKL